MVKEVAKLTSIEDYRGKLDKNLISAYILTEYWVMQPLYVVKIGVPLASEMADWLDAVGIERFAFVTAANPGSQQLPFTANIQRNALLLEALVKSGVQVHKAKHTDPSGLWQSEHSWWAPGILAETALGLAQNFGQNALVYWEKGELPALWYFV